MPKTLITATGPNFLTRARTGGDGIGHFASIYHYEYSLAPLQIFTLSKPYIVGSDTLMVFINGQKAFHDNSPNSAVEYAETNSTTVTLGAPLISGDVIEFYIIATYENSQTLVEDENSPVAGGPHSTFNFTGTGVTVTNGGAGQANITIPGAPAVTQTIIVEDENGVVAGGPHQRLNFTGAGVVASNAGGSQADITIPATENPVGTLIMLPHAAVPAGYLECNGVAISAATYSALFAKIGYSAGNPGGGNFRIPDYRGAFLRGWSHGYTRDPDRSVRYADKPGGAVGDNVGSFQWFDTETHDHEFRVGQGSGTAGAIALKTWDLQSNKTNYTTANQNLFPNPGTGPGTSGQETRPKNINVMFCIKYN